MFVADDQNVACRYGLEDENSPHRFSYAQMLKKTTTIGRLELFKSYREQPDDEVTLDSVTDQLVIAGTPDSVAEEILEFQEETGDLGELVYAGMDWVDPDLAQRSMEPIATKVMPQVNAHTGQAADD